MVLQFKPVKICYCFEDWETRHDFLANNEESFEVKN